MGDMELPNVGASTQQRLWMLLWIAWVALILAEEAVGQSNRPSITDELSDIAVGFRVPTAVCRQNSTHLFWVCHCYYFYSHFY
jgi:hypothetical protein